jgi:hypothetical protein
MAHLPDCGICYHPFDSAAHKPLILGGCGHTYCAACVGQLAGRQCPGCRVHFSQHMVNWQLLEVIEAQQQQQGEQDGICILLPELAAASSPHTLEDFMLSPQQLTLHMDHRLGEGGQAQVVRGTLHAPPLAVYEPVAVKRFPLPSLATPVACLRPLSERWVVTTYGRDVTEPLPHQQLALLFAYIVLLKLTSSCYMHRCRWQQCSAQPPLVPHQAAAYAGYYGVCEKDGAVCLVMQLYESGSLADITPTGEQLCALQKTAERADITVLTLPCCAFHFQPPSLLAWS